MPEAELLDPQPAPVIGEIAPKEGAAEDSTKPPEEIVSALWGMVKKVSEQERMARMLEVRRATKGRLFYRGLQYLLWSADQNTFQVGPTGAGQTGSSSPDSALEDVRYVFDIYSAYGNSFESVFCQNTSGIRFEPENPKDSDDIQAAQEADKLKRIIEKFNDPRELQGEVSNKLWTDSRVIAYTRYVTDGQQFGYESQPGLDGQRVAKGRELITIYGTLETKVPIYLRNIHEWPYAQLQTEHDLYVLKATWPDVADSITAGSKSGPEEEYAKLARLSVSEGTNTASQGEGLTHVGTCTRTWLRPSQYFSLSKTLREKLQGLYPDGVMCVFVGETFCEARNESMDDHLAVLRARRRDGQNSPAIGEPVIPLQETFNDGMNLALQYFERCIPAIWVDEQFAESAALEEQESGPGNYHPGERSSGEPMEDHFWPEPALNPPGEMMQWLETVQGQLAQFISGQLPAVWGGKMEGNDTASGYAMARNQALGLMTIVWQPFCSFYARVMLQAVKCAAKYRDRDQPLVQQMSGNEIVEVDISNLDGNLLAFPDVSEGFPESHTEKAAKFMELLTLAQTNEVIAETLALPDNLALAKDMIGMEDLTIPGQEARDKQLQEIAILLEGFPVPDVADIDATLQQAAQATAAGMEPPPLDPQAAMKPFTPEPVQVDADFDLHKYEWQAGLAWVNSPAGQNAKRSNPEGFNNVRLHLLEHKQLMEAQQVPMVPPNPAAPAAPQGVAPNA